MKFSERIGVTKPQVLQVNDMSVELKTALWNLCHEFVFVSDKSDIRWRDKFKLVYRDFFRWPTEDVSVTYFKARDKLKLWFFNEAKWFDIYNFIEFIINNSNKFYLSENLTIIISGSVNSILEAENSGYRVVSGVLTPITNTMEIDEIVSASSKGNNDKINIIHTHIKTAIDLLSQKPKPDYRNSIKESISAVEAAIKLITKVSSGGIKDAMKVLEKDIPIHGAMKDGIIKIYGWTSDSGGIRHALIEESTVGYDEAKYMLVICSAFVNYLVSRANALGKFAS